MAKYKSVIFESDLSDGKIRIHNVSKKLFDLERSQEKVTETNQPSHQRNRVPRKQEGIAYPAVAVSAPLPSCN